MSDDFNCDALGIEVDFSLPAYCVIRVLTQIMTWREKPQAIRCDNGPEYISTTPLDWAWRQEISIKHTSRRAPAKCLCGALQRKRSAKCCAHITSTALRF